MYEVYGGLLKEDIVCTINGKKVCCPPESTILEAARGAGIDIPTLCYLKGLTPTGACGICAVEIEEDGERVIRRSCRVRAKDGMVIYTNTPAVIEFRKNQLKEILKKHPNDCLTCSKTGGNCQLQIVSQILQENPVNRVIPKRGLDDSSPAMIRDMDKCIACGRCVTVCNEVQKIGIYEMKFDEKTGDRYVNTKKNVGLSATSCINCGQCVKVCPVGALTEKDAIHKAMAALDDPETTVVWQMAPAIQNTLGEEFCMEPGTDVTGKIAAAMKRLGGYAYTTDFSADVTIMEEGTEFIDRVTNGGVLPMVEAAVVLPLHGGETGHIQLAAVDHARRGVSRLCFVENALHKPDLAPLVQNLDGRIIGFEVELTAHVDHLQGDLPGRLAVVLQLDTGGCCLGLFQLTEVNVILIALNIAVGPLVNAVGVNVSVHDLDHAVAVVVHQTFLVGHQDDQLVYGDGLDYVHYLKGIGAVEISRRLVSYDYGRVLDDSASNAYTLSFTA